METGLTRSAALAGFIVAWAAVPARGQQFSWPENPENLQVLDVSGARLGSVMRGLTTALGVRCSTCHMGEEGQDLAEYDFVSDARPMKEKARVMMRMVDEINGPLLAALARYGVSDEDRLDVTCVTCHRGARRPEMIEDILAATIASDGIDAAVARYRELRDGNFGGFAYDFGVAPLTSLAESLALRGQTEDGVRIIEMALDFFPEDFAVHWSHAQVLLRAGRTEDAIAAMEEAAARSDDANRRFIEAQIARLRGRGPA